jgi:uncharacterized protein YndB with AHSA1/START domain
MVGDQLMKYAQGFMALLVGLIGAVFLAFMAGMNLPADVTVRRQVDINAPLNDVWAVVSDPAQASAWHPEVRSTIERPPAGGNPVWVEHGEQAITYTQVSSTPPRRLTVTTLDAALPFRAEWTIMLSEQGSGTRVNITQKATTAEPLERVKAGWWTGPSKQVDGWLVGLGAHFGETVSPKDAG